MSDQALAIPPAPKIGAATMEKVLIQGDLKTLSPAERVSYYDSVCRSLGLNPLTRPFEYLTLNGKVLLYARREATEQLRQIRGVSVSIKAREVTEGCYCVTAAATLPEGRQDESIGAVPIEGLKGESKANAMMKAETKAKRRVTLSICGLAFLDESEVDSVREAQSPGTECATSIGPRTSCVQGEYLPSVKPWTTFRGMIEAFGRLKEQLGPERLHEYYAVLARFGLQHANEFHDPQHAFEAYNAIQAALENFPQAPPEQTTEQATAAPAADRRTSNL